MQCKLMYKGEQEEAVVLAVEEIAAAAQIVEMDQPIQADKNQSLDLKSQNMMSNK